MSTAVVYAAYLVISIGLVAVVASGLSRSGQVVLAQMLGGDQDMARAVSRMLVIAFCLLSLGYVALTLRTSGQIHGAGQAAAAVSVKLGEELLAFGVLYLLDIAMFARFRRRHEAGQPGQAADGYRPVAPGLSTTADRPGDLDLDLAPAAGTVRPQPREALH